MAASQDNDIGKYTMNIDNNLIRLYNITIKTLLRILYKVNLNYLTSKNNFKNKMMIMNDQRLKVC